MKSTIILFMLAAAAITAQTNNVVVPDTKGNQILLSVANESKTLNLEKVKVTLANNPKGVEVSSRKFEIDKLKGGEEKEALFTFDAKRIPGTKKDTLRFNITDTYGESWQKEIIIEYALPKEFKLAQNYPNPFNPSTTIEFTIPQKGNYSLNVYNVLGQLVKKLVDGEYEPGYYTSEFNASRLASGIYIYRLGGDKVNIVKKMMLVK